MNPQLTAVFMTSEEVVYSKAVNTTAGAGWAEVLIYYIINLLNFKLTLHKVTITLPSAGVADSFILTKGDSATVILFIFYLIFYCICTKTNIIYLDRILS